MEDQHKSVQVMRTPNRGYGIKYQFDWDESPNWLVQLFGKFDENSMMYFNIDGDTLAIRMVVEKSVPKMAIYGNTHDGATYSWCKFYYSYRGKFEMTLWKGDWQTSDQQKERQHEFDQWKMQTEVKK